MPVRLSEFIFIPSLQIRPTTPVLHLYPQVQNRLRQPALI